MPPIEYTETCDIIPYVPKKTSEMGRAELVEYISGLYVKQVNETKKCNFNLQAIRKYIEDVQTENKED